MLSGVARTSATAAGLIMSMLPAAVAVLSLVTLAERVDGRTKVAIVLAVLGVGTLTLGRGGDAGASTDAALAGNAYMVGAVFCEAMYVVLGKRLTSASVGPMQISAWINLVGFTLMLPLGIWQGLHFDFGRMTPLAVDADRRLRDRGQRAVDVAVADRPAVRAREPGRRLHDRVADHVGAGRHRRSSANGRPRRTASPSSAPCSASGSSTPGDAGTSRHALLTMRPCPTIATRP